VSEIEGPTDGKQGNWSAFMHTVWLQNSSWVWDGSKPTIFGFIHKWNGFTL